MTLVKYCRNFLRVSSSHTHPKGPTRQIRFRIPTEPRAEKALTRLLRAEADGDLVYAIEAAKVSLRLSATPEQIEHATWFLESLLRQGSPPSEPAHERHVLAERCESPRLMAGGVL